MIQRARKAFTVVFMLIIISLSGCVNMKNQDPDLKRFELDLTRIVKLNNPDSLSILLESYPDFFPIFTEHIIGIGQPQDPNLFQALEQFIHDPVIEDLYTQSTTYFNDFQAIASQLKTSVGKLQRALGQKEQLEIVTYLSGFNQSFVTLPNKMAIGIDNYLGSNLTFYKQLGLPQYIIEWMNPQLLYPDAVRAWILSEMESRDNATNLLEKMIFEGIILYSAEQVLPKKERFNLFHYTEEEYQWLLNNEKSMWTYLVENDLLYSTDQLLIRRMTGEAPFTRDFGEDSAPKAGSWIGYRIVEKMMSKNRNDLNDLIYNLKPSEILSKSAYRPKN